MAFVGADAADVDDGRVLVQEPSDLVRDVGGVEPVGIDRGQDPQVLGKRVNSDAG
ncbi:hypothetical protein ACQEU3_44500 [Spirillospora sp. CA-253888]